VGQRLPRYKTIPSWVREILDGGEHVQADYKEIVSPGFADNICAAANTVALRSGVTEFVFLIGVGEATEKNGIQKGVVVGLVNRASGKTLAVEAQKKAVVDESRRVVPAPHIDIHECNTSTTPFLVVVVRPTDPPHRVDNRYVKRVGSHTVPLEQGEIRLLLGAKLREDVRSAEDEDLSSQWAMLFDAQLDVQQAITNLTFMVGDARDQQGDEMRAVRESLQTTEVRLDELAGMIGEVEAAAAELENGTTEIARTVDGLAGRHDGAVDAWFDVVSARNNRRLKLARAAELQRLPPEAELVVDLLFEAFLTEEPDHTDFPANFAERLAWRTLFQGGSEIETEDWRYHLDASVRAAVARAHRGRWSDDWMAAEALEERFDLQDLVVASETGVDPSNRLPSGASETPIVVTDAERFSVALKAEGARRAIRHPELLVWRASDCRLEARVHSTGVIAIVVVPQPVLDGRDTAAAGLRRVRGKLGAANLEVVRCYPTHNGRLHSLAGQRLRKEPSASDRMKALARRRAKPKQR
jgi:hypothetical protein